MCDKYDVRLRAIRFFTKLVPGGCDRGLKFPLLRCFPTQNQGSLLTKQTTLCYNNRTMRILLVCVPLFLSNYFTLPALSQASLNATQVLDKSIAYHDPAGKWSTFSATFVLKHREGADTVAINLPNEYFRSSDGKELFVTDVATCQYDYVDPQTNQRNKVDGAALASDSCAIARRVRNYHTYLNGLPMKLKDPGTQIEPTVESVEFHGQQYLRIKAAYDKGEGESEIWEFFFNPETFALQAYQFYGSNHPEHGEYLLLEDEVDINGIKLPRKKAWYDRIDDKYLGTDEIVEAR